MQNMKTEIKYYYASNQFAFQRKRISLLLLNSSIQTPFSVFAKETKQQRI